jgi:hypothetical protein
MIGITAFIWLFATVSALACIVSDWFAKRGNV